MGSKLTKLANRLDAIEKHLGLQNEENKPEILVGKWYKDPNSQYLVHVTKILGKHNYVEVYGFDCKGIWFDKWDPVVHQLCIEATPREVEQALIEEAKKRYKVGDIIKCFDKRDCELYGFVLKYDEISNSLYATDTGNDVVFNNGKWATIIEQDKFAELKEAHRNGAKIEFRYHNNENWRYIEFPRWDSGFEYRIKPEDKPKVGDWVQLSSSNIRKVLTVFEADKWREKKPLSQQEAIELLFGKENSK